MVDPNPARGMPLALMRFWLTGKGAAKIRWNMPGDFKRCVRALRKYFPTNPEGLCNILHTKATGGPPGHGSAEHAMEAPSEALVAAAQVLLASQQVLGDDLWAGPLAPINRPTGEPGRSRIFEHGALDHRVLPLPLAHRRVDANGHAGAVTVGRILGVGVGPDHTGQEFMWGWGDWLDASIVPEVTEARYLVEQGVAGASVDPGGRMRVTINPETGDEHITLFTVGGATLVRIAAFDGMRLVNLTEGEWPDDDPDMDHSALDMDPGTPDCGCGEAAVEEVPGQAFTVNPSGWHGLPLAVREAVFDNDDAVKRITAWSSGGQDVAKLRQAFMWRDDRLPETDVTSYRLPVGDIINGRLTMVYHAIYAAAALLSGAHGGLPNVPDRDKAALRGVISEIYPEMASAFNDSSIRAPWDSPAAVTAREQGMSVDYAADPKEPYGDVKYADPGYQDDGKKRYPLDSEEHCRAAWSYINQADNAAEYSPDELKAIKGRIAAALKRYGVVVDTERQDMSMDDYEYAVRTTRQFPVAPPRKWFDDPQLSSKTPLSVDPSGRVFGHLAAWNECHRDVTMNACVLAPRSRKGYAPFHLGEVFTAEGDSIRVGKIVMDTRHAGTNLRYAAAAIHYDNTGDEVAVVRAGEDEFGIWVAGAVVPEADAKKVAKLRRSPLSGDWRRVDGNLELTAALAVNVPAFPVFEMDADGEQMSLVAAGSVMHEGMEPDHQVEFEVAKDTDGDQQDRAWLLEEILADEQAILQWQRARQLADLFAAMGEEPPAVPGVDPVYGEPAMLTRQLDARFSIVEDTPGEDNDGDGQPDQEGATDDGQQAPVPTPV